ncbi:MAG TPA: DUF4157 domain-containing protein [Pyrinomonadaceae bacterium]|jgi:hypothetical protein|nr:DUF4157 domain-containing protein [Pyrinomonadaceae bacterium]
MPVTYGDNTSRSGLSGPQRAAGLAKRKPTTNRLWQSLATRAGAIQPKLTVSQVNDPQEREADRIADGVTQMPQAGKSLDTSASRATDAGRVQLKSRQGAGEDSANSAPPIVHETLNAPGRPLDRETRSFMEDRFDTDFGHVQVHTGARAEDSARAVNAHAYTVGSDIVFAAPYSPTNAVGRKLLAHELTHVVQQQGVPSVQRMTLWRKAVAIRFQDEPTLDEVSDGKKILKEGAKGEAVIRITTALSELGHYTNPVVNEFFDIFVKTAVSKFQDAKGLKGKAADGCVDKLTFDELDKDFSASYKVERDVIGKQKSGDLLKGTQSLDDEERTASARAISTEVRINPVTKKLPDFQKEIKGKGKYADRLLKIVEAKIVDQYNRFGKGKDALHADPKKLHDPKQLDVIAGESQSAVDKVFGEYTKGMAPAQLKQGTNVFDAWDTKEKDFKAGGKTFEDKQVAWRVNKIFTGDAGVAALDEEHGAVQSRADEKAIIDKIRTDMINKYRPELIATHKGWPGYEDKGNVYIQLFMGADDDAKKQDMWRYYQTFIHEYLHALEHKDHIAYRDPMSEKEGGKTLREGTADYFTKITWNSITITDALRTKIEGAFNDPKVKTAIPSLTTYHESKNAERLAGIVGLRNVAAAFFLGKVELVGKK